MEGEPSATVPGGEPPAGPMRYPDVAPPPTDVYGWPAPAQTAVTIDPPHAGKAPPSGPVDEWAAAACSRYPGSGGKLTVTAVLSGICLALSVAAVDVLGFFALALPVFVLALSFFCRCGVAVLPKLWAVASLSALATLWYFVYGLATSETFGQIELPGGFEFPEDIKGYGDTWVLSFMAWARFGVSIGVLCVVPVSIRGVQAFRHGLPPPCSRRCRRRCRRGRENCAADKAAAAAYNAGAYNGAYT